MAVPLPTSTSAPVAPQARPAAADLRLPRRLQWGLLLAVLAPTLLLLALATYSLHQSRQQYEDRAVLLTQNLAGALDRSVSANVEKIDLMLSSLVDHLERQLATGPLDLDAAEGHIQSQMVLRARIEGLRVADAQGRGIAGPGLRTGTVTDFSDRAWFIAQRDAADSLLHMSQPLRSKLNGHWIVSFSRRYRHPDGRFAGAVSAAVPLTYFSAQLQGIDAGPHGMVSLRDPQLGLIARHNGGLAAADEAVGTQQVSVELRTLVTLGRAQATYRALSPLDGAPRIFSYRRLSVVPLVVVVGINSADYLQGWQAEARHMAALGGLILLLALTGGALLWRMLRAHQRARQRIELLANVFDSAGAAIMVSDYTHHIIDVNPAFSRQTGYSAQAIIGQHIAVFNAARVRRSDMAAVEATLAADGLWRGEYWCRASDGREYPALLSISVLRDADGQPTNRIFSAIDITESKRAQEEIRHLALHDALTQLPNRENLLGRLTQALAAARRDSLGLAMLFIDMDRFKTINDTLGHHVGDGLLVQVGQRLRALVRDGDIVARLGGDEFVVVLTQCALPGDRAATAVARKITAALGQPYQVAQHLLRSTPSIGVSLFPADGEDPSTLMRHADTAMYQAKAKGRNGHQFYTAAMNQASSERLALEAGLHTAIERGELHLHFQPQVDLPSGQVVCLEALLRWRHPTLGNVPPLKFIPVAEDTGLIEPIGDWVMDQALAQLALWRADGLPRLRVAVNLSAQQMRDDRFALRVAQALARHQLPGDALELEITESVAMHDPTRTAVLLRQLRQQGVALAIDDFGTGHSSLAYLKQLPLSCLKLDRSFVMDIEHDPNDAAICTATIQMAHSLGLGVVAEGVETAAQLEFLRRLGCDVVQGYHFSRPLPPDEAGQFLHEHAAAATA